MPPRLEPAFKRDSSATTCTSRHPSFFAGSRKNVGSSGSVKGCVRIRWRQAHRLKNNLLLHRLFSPSSRRAGLLRRPGGSPLEGSNYNGCTFYSPGERRRLSKWPALNENDVFRSSPVGKLAVACRTASFDFRCRKLAVALRAVSFDSGRRRLFVPRRTVSYAFGDSSRCPIRGCGMVVRPVSPPLLIPTMFIPALPGLRVPVVNVPPEKPQEAA